VSQIDVEKTMEKTVETVAMLVLFAAACLASGHGLECPPGCSRGRWSTDAVDLSSEKVKAPYISRDIRIHAPDRQKLVHVVKDHWWVEVGEKRIPLPSEPSVLLYPAELAWAPDSQAFFITSSVGFSTGFHADVYRIVDNKLVLVTKLDAVIRQDFDRRHKCSDGHAGNDPNVAGLRWLGGSDRLLMIAEVPPIGTCKNEEYFGGYEMSVGSGRILGRFSPQQLVDRWGQELGDRLKSNLDFLSAAAKGLVP